MIPCEVPDWRDKVGQVYRTKRFGSVPFCPFGVAVYENAARAIIPWEKGLIEVGSGCEDQPRYGHPLTQTLLKKASELLKGKGIFYSNGFYRPPGLTWGVGVYQDPYGVIDSTDVYGHWRLAIDIARRRTAESFGVTVKEFIEVMDIAGFERPFLRAGEGWHFRPKVAMLKDWAKKGLTQSFTADR